MMSIERELLKKIITGDDEGKWIISHILYNNIKELLAQPEQQEPVAWMWEEEFCDEWTTVSSIIKPKSDKQRKNIQPLYTAPPKLERINHDDILDRSIDGSFEYRDGFMDGIMFALICHHSIGGGE